MASFRRWRGLRALVIAGAVVGAAGCGADAGSSDVRDPAEEAAEAPLSVEAGESARAHRPFPGRGPGGHAFLLMAALHELDLTQAQRTTIEGALNKAAPGPRGRGPMDPGPFKAIAEGVRAGKIDTTAVLAKIGGEGRGPEEHGARMAEALQTLHATLTKEQRRALIDTVTKRMADHGPPGERAERAGERGPLNARRGDKGPRARAGEPGAMPPPGGPLGHLLHDLDLTDAQREAVDRALEAQRPAAPDEATMKKRFEAHHTEMRARLEGFAADTFDAKAFVAPPAGAEAGGPKHGFERMVKDLAVVVPILEPAQREALAAQLENGPPAPPMGRPGGRGPSPSHERGPQGAGPQGAPAP